MSCLNPFITIVDQVAEPLIIHDKLSRNKAEKQAIEMMKKVGIRDAEKEPVPSLMNFPEVCVSG